MSYNSELDAITRQPQTVVILNLDRCIRAHGVSPCLAAQTGDAKSYNTRGTCNFPSAYLNGDGRNYKFSLNEMPPPFPGETVYPYLLAEPTYLSTKIDPSKSITENARVTLKFADELSNDSKGIDPYFSERTYFPNASGTFWRKLIARNPHYRGRTATIKQGFHGLSESEYVSRQYIIDQIEIKKDGTVHVILKDFLKKADRAMIPAPTSGTVADDPLSDSATTINYNLDDDKHGEYPEPSSEGDFYIRIDDEICKVTDNDRDNEQFTVERAQTIGSIVTVGAEHNLDAKIQLCYVAEAVNGVDIALEMIEDYIPLDVSLIDVTGFEAERDEWLTSFIFTGIISKPMPVSKALQELQESMNANIWWSEEDQLVKFRPFTPLSPGESAAQVSWNDDDHIISINTKGNEDSRVSQAILYYSKKVLDDDGKEESYESWSPKKNTNSESSAQYGEPAIKNIFSRWIITGAVASVVANRTLARFSDPPKKGRVIVELKDSGTKTANIVKITSDMVVDFNGFTLFEQQYEVIQKRQISRSEFEYHILDTAFSKRPAFIGPGSLPDYDSATDEQKRDYAFIGNASGQVGVLLEDGYYIV